MYHQRLNNLRQENAINRQQFNSQELEQSQQTLAQTQTELAQFQQSSGLVDSDEQIKGIVKTIDDLTAAQYLAIAQAEANGKRVKSLSSRLNMSPTQAIQSLGLGENQDYQSVRSKLKEIEIKLNELRATRTDNDPVVEDLLTERKELQRQLQQYVQQIAGTTGGTSKIDEDVSSNTPQGRVTLIQQLVLAESSASAHRQEATQLSNQIAKLRDKLNLIPKNQNRLQELRRRQEIAEGVYQGLVAQVQQAKIDAFSAYPSMQVLEAPTVDPVPTSPKLSLAFLNVVFGSIVGSAALLLWLEKRNPLLSPRDLQIFNFPTIFCISRFKNATGLFNLKLEQDAQVELEFQRLASAVSLQRLANRRILITSSISGEGKTTVTIGLSKALADLGFRVLVVDGDFRKAELSTGLAVDRERARTEKLIHLLPNLDLLPTWPQQGNIAAAIIKGKFEQSISAADAIGNYDCILIDSPPVSLTSEAALMAGVVSNVLFVVRPEICERNSAYNSFEQLSQYNAKIFGLVVNGVSTNNRAYPYYSHKLIETSSIGEQLSATND
jgi:Mrp family chromosome partitioning ATPase/capsule polysaccharide export protein KpsE/RkpR